MTPEVAPVPAFIWTGHPEQVEESRGGGANELLLSVEEGGAGGGGGVPAPAQQSGVVPGLQRVEQPLQDQPGVCRQGGGQGADRPGVRGRGSDSYCGR